MYSIPNPPFIQPLLENHAPGRKTWLTVRNDDIYTFRFGDPAYARQYILNMRSADKLAGFYMGPDGYIWGRDFLERHPDPGPRPLVMEKQWYWAYDCFEQPRLQHAATNWTLFVTKMGDFEKNADPSQSN